MEQDDYSHGTVRRYSAAKYRCRCALCRRAYADYAKAWRASRRSDVHVSLAPPSNAQYTSGCRCAECRAEHAAAFRAAYVPVRDRGVS